MVRSKTTNHTNQRFQQVHGLHCSFITTGEPTVRLVISVRSDRLKEQALNRRFPRHESRFLQNYYIIYYNYIIYTPNLRLITLSRLQLTAKVEMKINKADRKFFNLTLYNKI